MSITLLSSSLTFFTPPPTEELKQFHLKDSALDQPLSLGLTPTTSQKARRNLQNSAGSNKTSEYSRKYCEGRRSAHRESGLSSLVFWRESDGFVAQGRLEFPTVDSTPKVPHTASGMTFDIPKFCLSTSLLSPFSTPNASGGLDLFSSVSPTKNNTNENIRLEAGKKRGREESDASDDESTIMEKAYKRVCQWQRHLKGPFAHNEHITLLPSVLPYDHSDEDVTTDSDVAQ
ncbi:hypothetical protein BT69DRAFT_1336727 [Atractiella rhizophila]|nr:hypothetical protein BT69DRAFT_1336727 [Atractiella rhizophila]